MVIKTLNLVDQWCSGESEFLKRNERRKFSLKLLADHLPSSKRKHLILNTNLGREIQFGPGYPLNSVSTRQLVA